MVAAPFYTILIFTAKFPFMNLHSRKPAGPRNVENTLYYSALVITVNMMLMVTQDRKVYKDQDIEENSTLDICNTSFLLHTYCIVIEFWFLPEDYQSACDHR